MGLELYMVGLIVRDMPASLEFYRRLGVAIPEGSEKLSHVEVKMGEMTFFLDSKPGRWDPGFNTLSEAEQPVTARYPMILEFFLDSQAALAAKYSEMIELGYQSYREPYLTSFGMHFAMIKDPDGNTILLSAEVAKE